MAFLCRSGYRWIQDLNVFTVALQHSVLVTAGFKLPIMQRSLICEVSQVSSPCQHIYFTQRPPAMITWNNGLCRLMLILPHHTWQLNHGVEICGCHPAWVCFHPFCQAHWPCPESLRKGIYSFAEDRILSQFASGFEPTRLVQFVQTIQQCLYFCCFEVQLNRAVQAQYNTTNQTNFNQYQSPGSGLYEKDTFQQMNYSIPSVVYFQKHDECKQI